MISSTISSFESKPCSSTLTVEVSLCRCVSCACIDASEKISVCRSLLAGWYGQLQRSQSMASESKQFGDAVP